MSAWTEQPVLTGRFVTLEPLTEAHAAGLAAHATPDTYRFLSRGGPEDGSPEAWAGYVRRLNALPHRLNWAVRVGADVAGRISYSELREDNRGVEIGTMLTPPFQGSFVNPEAKYLLLARAFETLGAVRAQFKVDARNARSQRALEKLGAVREGVLRKYQTRPDGYVRDSVMFAVLDDEWPDVKARLLERLAAFSEATSGRAG